MTWVLLIFGFAIVGYPTEQACRSAGSKASISWVCVSMPTDAKVIGAGGAP